MSGSLASAPARAGAWIRDRIRGRALILGYHRVAEYDWDPTGLTVHPGRFRKHLEAIQRFGTVVPLSRLVELLDGQPVPRRAVALTFDDGYRDNLSVLLPLLKDLEVPCTVFVTTGADGGFFWWDELAAILHPSNRLPARLRLRSVSGADAGEELEVRPAPADRRQLYQTVAERFSRATPEGRDRILAELRQWAGTDRSPEEGARSLSAVDVEELARSPHVELGAHSVTHSRLGELAHEAARAEVDGSLQTLRAHTGTAVSSFSYPHGSASEATRRILAAAGVRYACSSDGILVERGSDPLHLPRFWPGDFDGSRFSRWLHARWFGL